MATSSYSLSGHSSVTLGTTKSTKASKLPFEELPNLPKPVIPKIDLGLRRADVKAMLEYEPSFATLRRVGYFSEDRSAQTEDSQILDVKHAVLMLQTLTQDIGQLRRDLNYAKHVLKANYETKIQERATELYSNFNDQLKELERKHQSKIEIIRKSYQSQLDNAIGVLSSEYKTYYAELMQGKTGRVDLKLKEAKQELAVKELEIQKQAAVMEQLTARLQELEGDAKMNNGSAPPPPQPTGITLEEAEELEQRIELLKNEVDDLMGKLSAAEDAKDKMSRQISSLNRQLEEEKSKFAQLRMDTEMYKKKVKSEQDKASKMAQSQLAAMEKAMKDKLVAAEKEAAQKAQEQAELERIRDQAKFQEELEKRMNIESELRSKASQQPPPVTVGDKELLAAVERLQRVEEQQKKHIERLAKELERSNKVWELKMTVMRKNYHALKDESFIRQSLRRQSAALHHATVGYAVSGVASQNSSSSIHSKELKALPLHPRLKTPTSVTPNKSKHFTEGIGVPDQLDTESALPIPPPSPNLSSQQRASESPTSRNVHFDEDDTTLNVNSKQETVQA